ncbi:MAG: site-specific integrase [Methylohalobius sp.]|nr:site-specific integrase [Methylohalobius sp.]
MPGTSVEFLPNPPEAEVGAIWQVTPSPEVLCALRGYLQGMPAAACIEAFLPQFSGQAERYLRGWLEELATCARRLGKPEWAKVLSSPSRTERGMREALSVLEHLARSPNPSPQPEHPLSWWLPKTVVSACRKVGLNTVQELVQGWKLLPKRTQPRLCAWLSAQGLLSEEGLSFKEPAPSSISASCFPKLFDSAWSVPELLIGREGSNRADAPPRIEAQNDLEAIAAWLSLWPKDSHTYRVYRKEAERFLLWCLSERGKPFSSMTPQDLIAYRSFLRSPPAGWIGPSKPRSHPNWRPFQGPLSEHSLRQAELILSALCQWLVEQRYLASNPFLALPKRRGKYNMYTQRAFSEDEWQHLLGYWQDKFQSNPTLKTCRTLLALKLAYLTGLRISELSQAKTDHIEIVSVRGNSQHWLTVLGKGGKPRKVPIPEALVASLREYLHRRGYVFSQLADLPPDIPLLASLRQRITASSPLWAQQETALSPAMLHRLFKAAFAEAAQILAEIDPKAADRLRRASAHWLRHTHGSHALDKGIPLTCVRDNLGHASLQTTSLYLHKEEEERFRQMEKLAQMVRSST